MGESSKLWYNTNNLNKDDINIFNIKNNVSIKILKGYYDKN